jgi:hypothetical protein
MILPTMSWRLPGPVPKPEKKTKKERGNSRSSNISSWSSGSSRKLRPGTRCLYFPGVELIQLTPTDERNEKPGLDDKLRGRPWIEDGADRKERN